MTYNNLEVGKPVTETSYYFVEYSEIRNKVRIRTENANHITKNAYQDALNMKIALNIDLMNGEKITDILEKI